MAGEKREKGVAIYIISFSLRYIFFLIFATQLNSKINLCKEPLLKRHRCVFGSSHDEITAKISYIYFACLLIYCDNKIIYYNEVNK